MLSTNYPVVILCSLTAFFFVALLAIILVANPKNTISRLFALYLLSSFIWATFSAFEALDVNAFQEFIFNRIVNILGVFPATISFLIFGLAYLKKSYKFWLIFSLITYLPLSYLMYTGGFSIVYQEPFVGGLRYHSRVEAGELLYLAIGWGALLLGILTFYLIRDLFTSRDKVHLKKVQLMLLAIFVSGGLALVFNAIPSLWVYPVDIIGQLVAGSVLTYAILRFELVDVSTKLRNVIVEIIFSTALATSFLALVVGVQLIFKVSLLWLGVVLAIFVTSLSQPFKERLLRFIDITFYRTRYDYRETINNFVHRVSEILDLQTLCQSIRSTTKETFGAKGVELFVGHENSYLQSTSSTKPAFFEENSPLVTLLRERPEIIIEDQLRNYPQVALEVATLNPELIVPLKSGESLVGILFIQERLSADPYSTEDKSLLVTLASSSAIALKNSILYQEVVEKNLDIERLLEREREVNESKNEFIAIASHFLRTPLTTIKGYLYLLINGKLASREARNYLLRTFNEQKKLGTLVEDIISISSLEKGELKLAKEKVSLGEIVKRLLTDYDSLATEKRIGLTVEIKKDVVILADRQKLTQAVANLVDNAVKFTSVGRVSVVADTSENQARVCVRDTGIGIESFQIRKLFQKFHRGTSLHTYNYVGSGLGLYIAKLIADAHGGKITVSSKLGTGSTFCLLLPLEARG
ncbi:MAG TPA: ATP-binding protein [Candidatus Nanoarchaeia archaeon]|nr:sensor histidine kinase RcsC [uncultured archaeon]